MGTETSSTEGRTSTGWTPLEAALRRSADMNRWSAAGFLIAFWTALITLDGLTGPHFSVNALYLVPLCFTTWCLGRIAGLASGLGAVVATLFLNGFGDGLPVTASTVPTATAMWNAGMRTFAVVFTILFVGAFRRTFDRERANGRVDPLTGLGNRRSFKDECRRLELNAARDGRTLLCGSIDVDDFKNVNDQQGHAAGDRVLLVVASALASAVRPYDATARLGGDEFAFCLAVRDEDSAERKTGKIHGVIMAALEASGWEATCSLGGAAGSDPEAALVIADRTMYEAKSHGKGLWRFHRRTSSSDTGDGLASVKQPGGVMSNRNSPPSSDRRRS